MQEDGGQHPERGETGGAVLRPMTAAKDAREPAGEAGGSGDRDRERERTGGREQLERIAVRVPPGPGEACRLDEGKGLAKGPEAGAEEGKAVHQAERGAPGLEARGEPDPAREREEAAETLLPAEEGDDPDP